MDSGPSRKVLLANGCGFSQNVVLTTDSFELVYLGHMRIIPVVAYPLELTTYESFDAAIAEGAINNHPLQPKAKLHTTQLLGTIIVDAFWTDTDFVISFSNELYLHIFAEREEVQWELKNNPPALNEKEIERVGSPPVICRWPEPIGDVVLDRSALTAKRRGCDFKDLFVHEMGFLVYCRRHLIWWFSSVCRTDLNQPMLWVSEKE